MIKQHEDNIFTKERDEIEKYLLRIIQRYFEIETNHSKASVESIIIESLMRFKRDIIDKNGFLFSFNGKTGYVNLTIRDFGGEHSFEKNTSFNCDFGTNANNICAGDDPRLEDKRNPLEHIHDIIDINGLKDTIYSISKQLQNGHYHENQEVLNILRYTGTQSSIDLIIIEDMIKKIKQYTSMLNNTKLDLRIKHNKQLDTLGRSLLSTQNDLRLLKELVNNSLSWSSKFKTELRMELDSILKSKTESLSIYATTKEAQPLLDLTQQLYTMTRTGELPIPSPTRTFQFVEDTQSSIPSYGTEKPGKTTITHTSKIEITVANSSEHIKLYFKYEQEGKTYTVPLPFLYPIPNGYCIVQGGVDSNGKVYIEVKVIDYVQGYITANNVLNNTVIFASMVYNGYYFDVINKLMKQHHHLCVIDNVKRNFIKQLLSGKSELYYINGFYDNKENIWSTLEHDGTSNVLSYTASDFTNGIQGDVVCISATGELFTVDSVTSKHGYIAEYNLKTISDYFTNPKIYYEVYKGGI